MVTRLEISDFLSTLRPVSELIVAIVMTLVLLSIISLFGNDLLVGFTELS
jgi:hypothetical protein